jgi:hypothetical protein
MLEADQWKLTPGRALEKEKGVSSSTPKAWIPEKKERVHLVISTTHKLVKIKTQYMYQQDEKDGL